MLLLWRVPVFPISMLVLVVNYDTVIAAEVHAVIEHVQDEVKRQFDAELHPEAVPRVVAGTYHAARVRTDVRVCTGTAASTTNRYDNPQENEESVGGTWLLHARDKRA